MTEALAKAAERWRLFATVGVGVLASLWYVVTFADDKIRKADQVPALAEAVLQLKVNEELGRARMERMEQRQDVIEQKQDAANAMILERLDKLLTQQN